jgi:hypothetical protein
MEIFEKAIIILFAVLISAIFGYGITITLVHMVKDVLSVIRGIKNKK